MNSYEKKANKDKTSQWLNSMEDTASDRKLPMGKRIKKGLGSSAIKILSGIGGGFAGAAIGRWSILGGILATGTGEVIGSPELTSFGVGMMASNLVPTEGTVEGTEEKKGAIASAKDRVKTYGKGIMQKFWLDKVMKKKTATTTTTGQKETATSTTMTEPVTTTEESTSGMGEVKYYTHPMGEPDDLDLSELDKFAEKIAASAENFSTGKDASTDKGVSGAGDDDMFFGNVDEEKIY